MQKTCFTFLLLIFLSVSLQAQNVFPVAADSAYWEIVTWNYFTQECIRTQIKTGAEVMHSGHTYTEVLNCDRDGDNCLLIGYYRIVGDSVMVKPDTNPLPAEALLYDFSKANGDSALCGLNMHSGGSTGLTQFRQQNQLDVLYEGTVRTTQYMEFNKYPNETPPTTFDNMLWIKGVGSDVHPFYALACYGDQCEMEQEVSKVVSNGSIIFSDTTYAFLYPCTGWVGLPEQETGNNIVVFPTLFEDAVTVFSDAYQLLRYTVNHATGQVVVTGKLRTGRNILHIAGDKGVYLLTVNTPGGQTVKKLVKQ